MPNALWADFPISSIRIFIGIWSPFGWGRDAGSTEVDPAAASGLAPGLRAAESKRLRACARVPGLTRERGSSGVYCCMQILTTVADEAGHWPALH